MRDRVPDLPSRRTPKVWVEQAIFTSLPRHGRGGYHLVSRSKGVSGQEAQAISRWSPSHGSLLQDQSNRVSVNFFSLPGGRFALSRSCEGPPEYSGRGGRQLYTHILIIDSKNLEAVAGSRSSSTTMPWHSDTSSIRSTLPSCSSPSSCLASTPRATLRPGSIVPGSLAFLLWNRFATACSPAGRCGSRSPAIAPFWPSA